jgi:Flp pilus assembly protein TadB
MSQSTDLLSEGLVHAGAGTSQSIVLLSVVIPGLFPSLVLLAAITVVVLLPLLVASLAAAVVAAPPYLLWRLATRGRRRRRRGDAHLTPAAS